MSTIVVDKKATDFHSVSERNEILLLSRLVPKTRKIAKDKEHSETPVPKINTKVCTPKLNHGFIFE